MSLEHANEPADHADEAAGQHEQPVVVYWRPGCGFCSSLLRKLDASGLAFERRNIWEDEDASAFVRTVANGNETVPTVQVGEMALVNPAASDVLTHVAEVAPGQLPDDYEAPQPGRMAKTVTRLLGG
jgi:mycoredoxin